MYAPCHRPVCPVLPAATAVARVQAPVRVVVAGICPKRSPCPSTPSPPQRPHVRIRHHLLSSKCTETRALFPSFVTGNANMLAFRPAKPFGCKDCKKSFTRFADLKRHQSSVHYPVFRNCPVEHCSRKGSNGFPRQDHLVEHLRSYHHLDVPKRRAFKRSAKYIS